MKKLFLRWLRQPIHSNFWRQTKVSLFKARDLLHYLMISLIR
jgi:hypothetical protein